MIGDRCVCRSALSERAPRWGQWTIRMILCVVVACSMLPATAHGQDRGWEMSRRGGPAGTDVSIALRDLPPDTPVLLGFGGVGSPHEILVSTVTDEDGVMTAEARVPTWVEPGVAYLFYMAYADQRPVLFSEPFLVTGPDGVVRLEGTITDEGTTCVAMRGPHDELFTLGGDLGNLAPGDRVVVVATIAEMSLCMQGLTLAVREVRTSRGP
jgi:hypothetical protein